MTSAFGLRIALKPRYVNGMTLMMFAGAISHCTAVIIPGDDSTNLLAMDTPDLLAQDVAYTAKESGLGVFVAKQMEAMKSWKTEPFTGNVTVVVGNAASDADSIITALTYAYLKHSLMEKGSEERIIPVVKCKRSEFKLRQETDALLQILGVDTNDIIHFDDKVMEPLMTLIHKKSDKVRIILTDHNKADSILEGKVDDMVSEILDHHKDEKKSPVAEPRIIRYDDKKMVSTVQSACTIVAQRYLETTIGQDLLRESDGAVACALLAVITIDSKGFKKADEDDNSMKQELENKIEKPESREYLKHEWLVGKKEDHAFWLKQTLEMNLLYDFKGPKGGCGVSSTFLSMEDFVIKMGDDKQTNAVETYKQMNPIYMIMLKRDPPHIAVMSNKFRSFTKKYIDNNPDANLNLTLVQEEKGFDIYLQGNKTSSRKQIAPFCNDMVKATR